MNAKEIIIAIKDHVSKTECSYEELINILVGDDGLFGACYEDTHYEGVFDFESHLVSIRIDDFNDMEQMYYINDYVLSQTEVLRIRSWTNPELLSLERNYKLNKI